MPSSPIFRIIFLKKALIFRGFFLLQIWRIVKNYNSLSADVPLYDTIWEKELKDQ